LKHHPIEDYAQPKPAPDPYLTALHRFDAVARERASSPFPCMHRSNGMDKPDAVIVDLDGTLLNAQRQCSPRNRRVLARCLQHGIPVVIATSRAPRSIRQLLGAAFLHQYSHVVLNGALAWAVSPWQERYQRPLATTVALHIVDAVLTHHASALISMELDGERLATNVPMDAPTLWQRFWATPDLVTSFAALHVSEILKITVNGQGINLMATGAWLQSTFGASIRVVPSDHGTFLNIMAADTTKEHAVETLLTSMGRTLSRAWVFGDDVPDLGMLQAAGVAVAMANACPEVQAVARYSTEHHNADGVAAFVEPWLERWGMPTTGASLEGDRYA
jgi:Cof subfamily protein (haloacid dehalogenase superfamily)